MSTDAQINANRLNSQQSTGPRTDSGQAASSQNARTHGLFSRIDYVLPDERDFYTRFCETLLAELAPTGTLELVHAAEITGASWRLRRCSLVEGDLAGSVEQDPLLDEKYEKTIRSIERARTSSLGNLTRATNQLRKLQTDRSCREIMNAQTADAGLTDFDQVAKAATHYQKYQDGKSDQQMASFCAQTDTDAKTAVDQVLAEHVAVRKPDPPRNAPCPCGSGIKFKRCCYRKGPGWEKAA